MFDCSGRRIYYNGISYQLQREERYCIFWKRWVGESIHYEDYNEMIEEFLKIRVDIDILPMVRNAKFQIITKSGWWVITKFGVSGHIKRFSWLDGGYRDAKFSSRKGAFQWIVSEYL